MRFDDSLATVLAGDLGTAAGREAAWRQLVDLIGRGRVGDVDDGVARLAAWREGVPLTVRAASARALAFASPPAALVALFAADDLAAAGPVLRTAMLPAEDWLALLPHLTPATRAVLRHRRDLPAAVRRGLESFGATDFVLPHDAPAGASVDRPVPVEAPAPVPEPPVAAAPLSEPPARIAPVVTSPPAPPAEAAPAVMPAPEPRFEIADLVARIDAFQRARPAADVPVPTDEPDEFHFVTDAEGVIRWVEGGVRGALIGVSLARAFRQGLVQVEEGGAVALRTRVAFGPLALAIEGATTVTWQLWGTPRFDRAAGRFIGMGGVGRRVRPVTPPAADQLRQLTHELRTPANAIAGFAELIGTELLGPAPDVYRDRARLIEREAGAVVAAIDDLDTAARVEGDALELRPAAVDLAELVRRAVADLDGVPDTRGVAIVVKADAPVTVHADDRALPRLLARLLTAAIAQANVGERVVATVATDAAGPLVTVAAPSIAVPADRDALLTIAAEPVREDGPLLGLAFTLRLARALAAAMGGTLAAEPGRLTLHLPAAHTR